MPLLNKDKISLRQNVSEQNSFSQNVWRQNTLRQNNSNLGNMKVLPLPDAVTQLLCEGHFKLRVCHSLRSPVFYWTGRGEPHLELLAGAVGMGRGIGILTRGILSTNILTGGDFVQIYCV